jgi:hypothetical protein
MCKVTLRPFAFPSLRDIVPPRCGRDPFASGSTGTAFAPKEGSYKKSGQGENLLRFCSAEKDDELVRAGERIASFNRQTATSSAQRTSHGDR